MCLKMLSLISKLFYFLKNKSQFYNYFNYAAIYPESENQIYRRNSAIFILKYFQMHTHFNLLLYSFFLDNVFNNC